MNIVLLWARAYLVQKDVIFPSPFGVPPTVSYRVAQCYAAIPRLLRKQLSDLSNVLAEMEARDAQRREQSQATKSKARHGEQPERAGKNCTVL